MNSANVTMPSQGLSDYRREVTNRQNRPVATAEGKHLYRYLLTKGAISTGGDSGDGDGRGPRYARATPGKAAPAVLDRQLNSEPRLSANWRPQEINLRLLEAADLFRLSNQRVIQRISA